MIVFTTLFKLHLRFIYFFIKLFVKTDDKLIVFMSRQYDKPSYDYLAVDNDIKDRYKDYKTVMLNKLLDKKTFISYYFHIYKQMYYLAKSKVCIVDTYIIPVSVLNHKKDLTIIQLCHGVGNIKKFGYQTLTKESGKGYELSKQMCMHRNYDYLISTSSATSKFYAEAFNIDESKIMNFGVPKIDYILNIKSKREEILNKYPELGKKKNILYVSTFRTYPTEHIKEFLNGADFDNYNIIVNIHPVMYKHNPNIDDTIKDFNIYRCSEFNTQELLSVADIAITDYSSFAFESAILDIPTYLYVPDYEKYLEYNGLNVDLNEELPNAVYRDSKILFDNLNKDYDYESLKKFKNKYIENTNGNATELLTDFIISKAKK